MEDKITIICEKCGYLLDYSILINSKEKMAIHSFLGP